VVVAVAEVLLHQHQVELLDQVVAELEVDKLQELQEQLTLEVVAVELVQVDQEELVVQVVQVFLQLKN
tara:strand:+ start:280 stop:483 length:204 start_codon:yes stop_codon:yes gene_type:complete